VLTRTADYALRAILVLARRGIGRPLAADAIAEITGTPRNYTSKTLHTLARAGLLTSTRGPSGGFALALAPDAISVAEIASVFAEVRSAPRCLLGSRACNPAQPCTAHHHWMRLTNDAFAPLARTTVADLLADSAPFGANGSSDTLTIVSGAAGKI
jgi:Rrf2 family protein